MKTFVFTTASYLKRTGLRLVPARTSSRFRGAPRDFSPSESEKPLRELARSIGIQTEYVDMKGQKRRASPDTLKAILQLWGIDAGTGRRLEEARREILLQRCRQLLPPVCVSWDGKPVRCDLFLPRSVGGKSLFCRIHYEDGSCRNLDAGLEEMRASPSAEIEKNGYSRRQLRLPPLPQGYHELEIAFGHRNERAFIISAPTRSYSPEKPVRLWGGFLPVYAAHSRTSWGAGTLAEWRQLSDWLESLGARMVATLPLLAGFLDYPSCDPSPYSPASRLFWSDFYIDVESTPEFRASASARRLASSPRFQQAIARLRQDKLVNYAEQQRLRRAVLERMAADFFGAERAAPSAGHREFRSFVEQRPALRDYAEFRATCDQRQTPWHSWDERMRNGKLQKGDFSETVRDYHLFTQWLAHRQISSFADSARRRGLRFVLDLPVGVNPDGYDLWRERHTFASPASAGAPPDIFFTKGQNWGFAPLHPERIRQRRYSHVLESLRFQMRYAGILRIDHVMGLHRLYWIPKGFPATEGAYVSYPAAELYAILSLESHRHQTLLAGENLGTVPPEVNQAMARHGLRQTYVVQYEQRPEPGAAVRPVPRESIASINTHDMPTFHAHWKGLDIDDRAALGLIAPNKIAAEKKNRQKLNAALVQFLRRRRRLDADANPSAVLKACLQWLAAGPAEVVQIKLEDLWGATEPQNVPGTSAERPNWRQKAALRLEEIVSSENLKSFLSTLSRLRPGGKASR